MVTTNYATEKIGSFVAGMGPDYPGSWSFGAGSTTPTTSDTYLVDEVIRVDISWGYTGSYPKGTFVLSTTDAIGSDINEGGLVPGATVGSDLWSRHLSAIGEKNETFSVTGTIEWKTTQAE